MAKKISGILTEDLKLFLMTPIDERSSAKGGVNLKKGKDKKIRDKGRQALKDLILISCGTNKKQNQEIFSNEDVANLLRAILHKQGFEKTDYGDYYSILVKAIEETMQPKFLSERGMTINWSYGPKSTKADFSEPLDLIEPANREYTKKVLETTESEKLSKTYVSDHKITEYK